MKITIFIKCGYCGHEIADHDINFEQERAICKKCSRDCRMRKVTEGWEDAIWAALGVYEP